MIPLNLIAFHFDLSKNTALRDSLSELLSHICLALINSDESMMNDKKVSISVKKLIKNLGGAAVDMGTSIKAFSKTFYRPISLKYFKKIINNLLTGISGIPVQQLLDIVYNTVVFQDINTRVVRLNSKFDLDIVKLDAFKHKPYIMHKIDSCYKYTLVLDLDETLIHQEVSIIITPSLYSQGYMLQRI
jgi:hypothetical protein